MRWFLEHPSRHYPVRGVKKEIQSLPIELGESMQTRRVESFQGEFGAEFRAPLSTGADRIVNNFCISGVSG